MADATVDLNAGAVIGPGAGGAALAGMGAQGPAVAGAAMVLVAAVAEWRDGHLPRVVDVTVVTSTRPEPGYQHG